MSIISRLFALLAAACIACALFAVRPPGEPGVRLRDFEAYYSAGATWLAHHDPYSLDIWTAESHVPGVVAARHEVLPFVGLPATLPFWALFVRFPYDRAATVWIALLVASLLVVVAGAARLAGASAWQMLLVVLTAIAFVPITSDFGLGQAALAAYAFTLIAVLSTPVFASLAIVPASLQPNVALGLLSMLYERRTVLTLVNAAIIVYLAGAVVAGPRWPAAYAATLSAHAGAESFATIQYTLVSILHIFPLAPPVATSIAVLTGAAFFVVAGIGAAQAPTAAQRFAIACCVVPFIAGFFHEHDFVVLFVPVVFALVHTRRPWLATIAAVLAGVNWLDFAQQPRGAMQDLVLAAGLFFACVAFRPQRSQLWAGLACAIVLAAGAHIGATHRIPIWPNDMHGAATGATIAAVWKNEQLQTGLLRPDAAAAVLRAFALLGAALLLYLTLDIDVHHIVERRDRVGMEVL